MPITFEYIAIEIFKAFLKEPCANALNSSRMLLLLSDLLCTFAVRLGLHTPFEGVLAKWIDYIHNLLIIIYKVTKNLPLGQICKALILLKIRNKRSIRNYFNPAIK